MLSKLKNIFLVFLPIAVFVAAIFFAGFVVGKRVCVDHCNTLLEVEKIYQGQYRDEARICWSALELLGEENQKLRLELDPEYYKLAD